MKRICPSSVPSKPSAGNGASVLLLLALLSVTSCASRSKPTPAPAFPVATPTALPPEECRWALKQDGPRHAPAHEEALAPAGLGGASVYSTCFTEDCHGTETGRVVAWGWVMCDFDVTLPVASLDDRAALGDALQKLMRVLASVPPQTPPQLGLIRVTFEAGSAEKRLAYTGERYERLRQRRAYGAYLLDGLGYR